MNLSVNTSRQPFHDVHLASPSDELACETAMRVEFDAMTQTEMLEPIDKSTVPENAEVDCHIVRQTRREAESSNLAFCMIVLNKATEHYAFPL